MKTKFPVKKVQKRSKPGDNTSPMHTYMGSVHPFNRDMRYMAEKNSIRSGVSVGDCYSVLETFFTDAEDEMMQGNIVDAGEHCSMYINVKSKGVLNPMDADVSLIIGSKVILNPKPLMQDKLDKMKCEIWDPHM